MRPSSGSKPACQGSLWKQTGLWTGSVGGGAGPTSPILAGAHMGSRWHLHPHGGHLRNMLRTQNVSLSDNLAVLLAAGRPPFLGEASLTKLRDGFVTVRRQRSEHWPASPKGISSVLKALVPMSDPLGPCASRTGICPAHRAGVSPMCACLPGKAGCSRAGSSWNEPLPALASRKVQSQLPGHTRTEGGLRPPGWPHVAEPLSCWAAGVPASQAPPLLPWRMEVPQSCPC